MSLLHLVGHDGTDHGDDALALARALGAERDVRRVVVHVLPWPGDTAPAAAPWADVDEAGTRERLARIRSVLAGDEVLEVLMARSPARGLHDFAERQDADLVSIGAHHRSPGRLHLATGTVAGSLLSGGPCAVAYASEGFAARAHALARIVVGFDGSGEARDALDEGAALAASTGALVDVVYAYDHTAYPRYPGTVAEAEQASGALAQEGLEALPEAVRGVSASRSGVAGPVVERFAEGQGADLIVLGSRGFGPVCRALLGSTGSHVLHHTDRPVIVVPRGARKAIPNGEPEQLIARA